MRTEFVIITAEDIDHARYEAILRDSGYIADWDECDDSPAEWTVRAPYRGEAEGTYYRRPGGSLQILGYSISAPEGLELTINAAFAQLCDAE